VLEDAAVDHGYRDKRETGEDARYRIEVDLEFAESWVDDDYANFSLEEGNYGRIKALTVKEWNEYDQSDWVEVLQEIVWCAMECHFSSLRDEIVPDLNPAYEIEGKKEKHLNGHY
jgi:hypothetical protein